jgi:hypothetical protein
MKLKRHTFGYILCAILALACALQAQSAAPSLTQPFTFDIEIPSRPNAFSFGISPDGKKVAYVATPPSGRRAALWVRSLDARDDRMLPGTENAVWDGVAHVLWAPDSRNIAYPALNGNTISLMKVGATGGAPEVITVIRPSNGSNLIRRAYWSSNDLVFFANDVVYKVSSNGGPVSNVTTLDQALEETSHSSPWILPDGRHFLYRRWSRKPENSAIHVGSLVDPTFRKRLSDANSVRYADGHILFTRESLLFAQPFDAERLALTGPAVQIATDILYEPQNGFGAIEVSAEGTLIYRVATPNLAPSRGGQASAPDKVRVIRNWTSLLKK